MFVFFNIFPLNYYDVVIDGQPYGRISYGSWIYIEDNHICVRDIATNIIIETSALIDGTDFNGWMTNNEILTTCMVQDVLSSNGVVEIYGMYNRKVSKVTLNANGGDLFI